ncbi:MAG: hypothetical protein MRJ93_00755 [Nitrososphaeraceae archaeon]|nr:hypothetical protein [Nitrososphaeraceae archaeon]
MDKDKIVYFGVININENGRTIGAVDVWRSVITKELFCEEKRLGILDIVDYIGMPKKNTNEKWCIAINKNRAGKDRWKLIKIIKEGKVSFYDTDDESIVETIVHDYKISDNIWWSFLVEKYINKTVEISKELRIP